MKTVIETMKNEAKQKRWVSWYLDAGWIGNMLAGKEVFLSW